TKKRIRFTEEALENGEKFASVATLFGSPYPQHAMNEAWKELLLDQFHDIMPGSGIGTNYLEAGRRLDLARRVGNDVEKKGMKEIAANIDTRGEGVPVIVWNPLNWERSGVVETEILATSCETAPHGCEASVRDAAGKFTDAQIVPHPDTRSTLTIRFFADDIPPLGYKVYYLGNFNAMRRGRVFVRPGHIENQYLSATVDMNTGCITSLIEKKTNQETVAKGGCANLLQMFVDKPKHWDAWNIDADFEKQKWDLTQADEVKLIESGPLRAVIRVKKHFQDSQFVQDITLEAGSPRLDVHMSADWHEKHILMKVAFPVNAVNTKATFEIPYGSIERPTTRNTPEEKAKFEVPALQWADYSQQDRGVSVLNNCKYGYDAKNDTPYNLLRLSLLRSPEWPDPTADQGHHEFTYSFYPHAGTWKDAMTVRQGYELNYPMTAMQEPVHAGPLPASYSFVKIDAPNVVLTAVKKAEDDSGLLIRYYEWAGKEGDVRIDLPQAAATAEETNLMEKTDHSLALADAGKSVTVPTKPYEIKTVKVTFKNVAPAEVPP